MARVGTIHTVGANPRYPLVRAVIRRGDAMDRDVSQEIAEFCGERVIGITKHRQTGGLRHPQKCCHRDLAMQGAGGSMPQENGV